MIAAFSTFIQCLNLFGIQIIKFIKQVLFIKIVLPFRPDSFTGVVSWAVGQLDGWTVGQLGSWTDGGRKSDVSSSIPDPGCTKPEGLEFE